MSLNRAATLAKHLRDETVTHAFTQEAAMALEMLAARAEAAEATIARVREQSAIKRKVSVPYGDFWNQGWNAAMKAVIERLEHRTGVS